MIITKNPGIDTFSSSHISGYFFGGYGGQNPAGAASKTPGNIGRVCKEVLKFFGVSQKNGDVTRLLKVMPKFFEYWKPWVHPPPYEGERESLTVLWMWPIKKLMYNFSGLRKKLETQGCC